MQYPNMLGKKMGARWIGLKPPFQKKILIFFFGFNVKTEKKPYKKWSENNVIFIRYERSLFING